MLYRDELGRLEPRAGLTCLTFTRTPPAGWTRLARRVDAAMLADVAPAARRRAADLRLRADAVRRARGRPARRRAATTRAPSTPSASAPQEDEMSRPCTPTATAIAGLLSEVLAVRGDHGRSAAASRAAPSDAIGAHRAYQGAGRRAALPGVRRRRAAHRRARRRARLRVARDVHGATPGLASAVEAQRQPALLLALDRPLDQPVGLGRGVEDLVGVLQPERATGRRAGGGGWAARSGCARPAATRLEHRLGPCGAA